MGSESIDRAAVLKAIQAVRERHTPPSSAVGSVPSEALRVCDEIGSAVLALPADDDAGHAAPGEGMTIRNLVTILTRNGVLDKQLRSAGRPVMSVATLREGDGIEIEMNTRAGE